MSRPARPRRTKVIGLMAAALTLMAASFTAPAGAHPPFKHIVIIFQENRTPDNLFGSNPAFEPGVDIATTGVTSKGKTVQLTALPLDDCYDIAHSHDSFEFALHDGFDKEPLDGSGCTGRLPPNPHFKFADNSTGTVQPYFDIATANGFANRMFQTNQGPSFPAHQFIFGGTSAPSVSTSLFAAENMGFKGNAGCIGPYGQTVMVIGPDGNESRHPPVFPCFEHPTLGDVLSAANPPVSWRYYAPMPGNIWTAPDAIRHICQAKTVGGVRTCTGPEWTANVVPDNPAQVLTDIAACALPGVSWVIPTAAESDHAAVNTGIGPQWVATIVNAIGGQSCGGENYWTDTAIFIAWDDWGGWFDHVKPLQININQSKWGSGYTYGFRVPLLVVSAFTPAGFVSNENFDFGSILAFTERNFGLGFIGPGAGIYSRYADYQASAKPFGKLESFFTLRSPKPFVAIATSMTAKAFIDAPRSNVGPDDD
jgi:phospholipase C